MFPLKKNKATERTRTYWMSEWTNREFHISKILNTYLIWKLSFRCGGGGMDGFRIEPEDGERGQWARSLVQIDGDSSYVNLCERNEDNAALMVLWRWGQGETDRGVCVCVCVCVLGVNAVQLLCVCVCARVRFVCVQREKRREIVANRAAIKSHRLL